MKFPQHILIWSLLGGMVFISGCAAPPSMLNLNTGYQDYRATDYVAASGVANQFITQNPTSAALDEAYYLRAISREARGNLTGAAADYRRAISLSHRPDLLGKSYKALGDMAFVKSEYAAAATDYLNSLHLDPAAAPDPLMLFRVATSLQNTGHWNQARTYYAQLAGGFPQSPLATVAMSRMALTHFAIQYGAYIYSQPAWAEVNALKNQGIAAVVLMQVSKGRRFFVVQSGQYPTYADALAARQKIAVANPQAIVSP